MGGVLGLRPGAVVVVAANEAGRLPRTRKDSRGLSSWSRGLRRFCRWSMPSERGADSNSVDPAGNQAEHAGRSQVNVIRSSNSGLDRIAFDGGWEGERFLLFPLLLGASRDLAAHRACRPGQVRITSSADRRGDGDAGDTG